VEDKKMEQQTVEKKPFWVSEDEVEGLKGTPQDDLSEQLKDAVPELTEVENPQVVGRYGFKDGILVYHIHHPARKQIFDKANEDMDAISQEEKDPHVMRVRQGEIAKTANEELDQHPWWENIEMILEEVFSEVFKHAPHKITFYQEVDAWSVILPETVFPMQPPKEMLEKPFVKIAERVMG
jgi:hypothetical protein